ncbi:P protein isoform X1, partial [Tachysurus ichikawai]
MQKSREANDNWGKVFYNWTIPLHSRRSDQILKTRTFAMLTGAPIQINVQAFLQDNQVVPLSMTHQALSLRVETQVLIAGLILTGVYVLIIFEINVQAFLQDNQVVPLSMTHQALSLRVETQVLIAGLILTGVYVLIIFE